MFCQIMFALKCFFAIVILYFITFFMSFSLLSLILSNYFQIFKSCMMTEEKLSSTFPREFCLKINKKGNFSLIIL